MIATDRSPHIAQPLLNRQDGSVRTWMADAAEDESLLASAVAVVQFARTERGRLHPDHPRRLVNDAVWFLTERGSPSRKYQLRYRTPAALLLQQQLTATAAAAQLAHEHVHERRHVVAKLLADEPVDVFGVLAGARACVVTRAEHHELGLTGARGWARYLAAGIVPIDLVTGEQVDVAALTADDPLNQLP